MAPKALWGRMAVRFWRSGPPESVTNLVYTAGCLLELTGEAKGVTGLLEERAQGDIREPTADARRSLLLYMSYRQRQG